MIILLVALLAQQVAARVPQCAVLFCGDADECRTLYARQWVDAAQSEAARVYNSVNGGFLAAECTPNNRACRVPPLPDTVLHKVLCLDAHCLPREECAAKHCNFGDHPELFEDDECVFGRSNAKHKAGDKDTSACRALKSWLRIGNEKLVIALSSSNATEAASAACAAETVFRAIADYLRALFDDDELPFLNSFAQEKHSYRHNNSLVAGAQPEFSVAFDGAGQAGSIIFDLIVAQSYRTCWRHETQRRQTIHMSGADGGEMVFVKEKTKRERLASVLLYSAYNGTNAETQTQLLWSIGGALAPFAQTLRLEAAGEESKKKEVVDDESSSSDTASVFTEYSDDVDSQSSSASASRNDIDSWFDEFEQRPNNEKHVRRGNAPPSQASESQNVCTLSGAESNVEVEPMPFVELGDYVVVRGDGATRRYRDLRGCGTVVLLGDARNDAPQSSFSQLQLSTFGVGESAALNNGSVLADSVAASLFARVASDQVGCFDTEGTLVFDTDSPPPTNVTLAAPTVRALVSAASAAGAPLTLAPGASRCVGGTRRNAVCESPSECGAGLACRRRPFDSTPDAAYCYDGTMWLVEQPCAFADADEECPYGECVGAASGFDGGAFPLLHFARDCGTVGGAGVCGDTRVQKWHLHSTL